MNLREAGFTEDWDFEKNEKPIESFAQFSNQKAWWKCKQCKQSYYAVIASKTRGYGCPICTGRLIIPDYNSLAARFPEIAAEWHPTLNGTLTPSEIGFGSSKKVYFQCKNNPKHVWKVSINSRTSQNSGCPYCNNRYVDTGRNDLLTLASKDIMLDWDYTKNIESPSKVFASSGKLYFWKCHICGYEWKNSPVHQLKNPKCSNCIQIQENAKFQEKEQEAITLKKMLPSKRKLSNSQTMYTLNCPVCNYTYETTKKSSFYSYKNCPVCSNHKIIQGVNDFFTYHPELANEYRKDLNTNIDIATIAKTSKRKAFWECPDCHYIWKTSFASRAQGHGCPVCHGYQLAKGVNDLQTLYPDLVESEWDYEKNTFLPSEIAARSDRSAFWHCSNGHNWESKIHIRTSGFGCPVCSNHLIISGVNDFKTCHPELAAEWNEPDIDPGSISPGSNKKIHWKCKNGHTWIASVYSRTGPMHSGCPVCSHLRVESGINDLASLRPDLLKEWDYERNTINPSEIGLGYRKRVFFKCSNNHSYDCFISDKIHKKTGCPYCSGHRVLKNATDLATLRPDLASQWDYTKNSISPDEVTCGSSKRIYWLCDKGHSWDATVSTRIKSPGCPYCSGLRLITGINDIATVNPHLIKEWAEKNSIAPSKVPYCSNQKYYWKCNKCDNIWAATPAARNSGTGCPYCCGKIPIKGVNDFATLYPQYTSWIDEDGFDPSSILPKSRKLLHWRCQNCSTRYTTRVYSFVKTVHHGCPICSGHRKIKPRFS